MNITRSGWVRAQPGANKAASTTNLGSPVSPLTSADRSTRASRISFKKVWNLVQQKWNKVGSCTFCFFLEAENYWKSLALASVVKISLPRNAGVKSSCVWIA